MTGHTYKRHYRRNWCFLPFPDLFLRSHKKIEKHMQGTCSLFKATEPEDRLKESAAHIHKVAITEQLRSGSKSAQWGLPRVTAAESSICCFESHCISISWSTTFQFQMTEERAQWDRFFWCVTLPFQGQHDPLSVKAQNKASLITRAARVLSASKEVLEKQQACSSGYYIKRNKEVCT